MYKTIRHGENSLQYTILPQNDDFRVEGKLSSAGSRKSKTKRPKRRSFFAYLGLIFVCTVIVGAVLIPFLVSAECLPSPTEWFIKTKAAFNKVTANKITTKEALKEALTDVNHKIDNASEKQMNRNVGKAVQIIHENGVEKFILRANKSDSDDGSSSITNTSNSYGAQNPPDLEMQDKLPRDRIASDDQSQLNRVPLNGGNEDHSDESKSASHPLKNNPPLEKTENFVTEVRFESAQSNNGQFLMNAPTIVVTTVRSLVNNYEPIKNDIGSSKQTSGNGNVRPTSTFYTANVNSPRAPTNSNQLANSSVPAMPTIMTRIIQVPLLKSAAKKPIIPPVLAKTNSQIPNSNRISIDPKDEEINQRESVIDSQTDDVKSIPLSDNAAKTKNADWIRTHWPYIDPSTYFQWTGYKAEDSVLLPALLGFALIGVILIVTVCLVARNKRTIVSSVRKRNRNDVEATGADDNATLLTTAALSDED